MRIVSVQYAIIAQILLLGDAIPFAPGKLEASTFRLTPADRVGPVVWLGNNIGHASAY